MFPKGQRIPRAQILPVFRRGVRRTYGVVSCYLLPKPGTVKVAVIVDSKVARKAVDRNLLKRRVRASLHQQSLPSGQLIVKLMRGALDLSYTDLEHQLQRCLHGLGR